MRNNVFLSFALLFLMALSACKKAEEGVTMSYLRNFEVQGGLSTIATHNFTFTVDSDTANFWTNAGIRSADISSVEPSQMRLQMRFSNGVTFGFIQQIEVTISAPDAPALGQKIVFFRDEISIGTGETLNLLANDAELKPFMLQKRYSIKLAMRLRQISPQNMEVQLDWSFFAKR